MKKTVTLSLALLLLVGGGIQLLHAQSKKQSSVKVLYFNPEIYPNFEEIQNPTYETFFSTVTNFRQGNYKIIRLNNLQEYDNPDPDILKEYCENNDAEYVVIPKIKYFKVGIGKLVLSNQVCVSMKLYNKEGELLSEVSHDTYKKNKRLLGSAENAIVKGTEGALKTLKQNLKKFKKQ